VNNFFITPSWKSMRFAKPLAPGGRYLSYVRMVPAGGHSFTGDVYILQENEIVGMVKAILFTRWPRAMLNRFFSPPDSARKPSGKANTVGRSDSLNTPDITANTPQVASIGSYLIASQKDPTFRSTGATISRTSTIPTPESSEGTLTGQAVPKTASHALRVVAEELAVEVDRLTDEVRLADLGLDSLMSLVLAQKLREKLAIEIRDAFFLEVHTIGELKKLLC
jgi:acyl carrier protein